MQELLAAVQGFLQTWGVQSLFVQVFILGVFTTLPIGPWSVVAMDQTRKYGRKHGLMIATSATVGDIVCAALCVAGFATLYPWMQNNLSGIYVFTSLLVMAFGIHFLLQKREKAIDDVSAPTTFHRFMLKFFKWCRIPDERADKIYIWLSNSRKFTYLVTFFWSAFIPGNIVMYLFLCFIVQGLGHDFSTMNVTVDYILPLFISTLFMWCSWIIFGKVINKYLYYIMKGFGLVFIIVGVHMFYTHAF